MTLRQILDDSPGTERKPGGGIVRTFGVPRERVEKEFVEGEHPRDSKGRFRRKGLPSAPEAVGPIAYEGALDALDTALGTRGLRGDLGPDLDSLYRDAMAYRLTHPKAVQTSQDQTDAEILRTYRTKRLAEGTDPGKRPDLTDTDRAKLRTRNRPDDFTADEKSGIVSFGDPNRFKGMQLYKRNPEKLRRLLDESTWADPGEEMFHGYPLFRASRPFASYEKDYILPTPEEVEYDPDVLADTVFRGIKAEVEAYESALAKAPSRRDQTLWRITSIDHLPEVKGKIERGEFPIELDERGFFATSQFLTGAQIIGGETAQGHETFILRVTPKTDTGGLNTVDLTDKRDTIPEATFPAGMKLRITGKATVDTCEQFEAEIEDRMAAGDPNGADYIRDVLMLTCDKNAEVLEVELHD